jgi:hypothetical protein
MLIKMEIKLALKMSSLSTSFIISDIANKQKFIITPNVINYAKQFYNCSTIDRLPLEKNGESATASQHWSTEFFGVI